MKAMYRKLAMMMVLLMIVTSVGYASDVVQNPIEKALSKTTSKQRVVVLTYHHILKAKDKELYHKNNGAVITLESFEQQMAYLYNQGYNTITCKDLEDFILLGRPLPKSKNNLSVLITFDDGYLSSYSYAYPVLKSYGFRATSFVMGKFATQDVEALDPSKLEYISMNQLEASKDVFDYASHSFDQHGMQNGEADMLVNTEALITEDLEKSQTLLEGTAYFAYPFSAYDDAVIDVVEDYFKLAFIVEDGIVTYDHVDPMEIPRYSIYPWTKYYQFKWILNQ